MSRWTGLVGAVVLGLVVVGCGTNGGDPVARQQVPVVDSSQPDMNGTAAAEVDPPAGSDQTGSDGTGSDGTGSGQTGSGGDHARKVGLPESIRIREIGEAAFKDDVTAACGSPNGADGCLTVSYVTEDDPGKCGAVEWVSVPDKVSDGNGESTVERGSTITATVFTCPEPGDTTTPAPDTSEPAPETSEPETASP